MGTSSCSDFLEQSSPSEVDKEFVVSTENTLRGAMYGIYDKWRGDGLSHGNGTFYNFIVSGKTNSFSV